MVVNQRGVCYAPHCRTITELCEWGHCGVCCRRVHRSLPNHVAAPPITGALVLAHDVEKPTADTGPPVLGSLEVLDKLEFPLNSWNEPKLPS